MEQKLQLCVFMLLLQVSLAVWQRVTVIKGQTVELSCPITNAHQTIVDWKNPQGYIMFFMNKKAAVIPGVKDKRYSINKLSESEFTVSISDVTFTDGGNYTCSQYGSHTTDRTVEVTVLGHPKVTKTKHKRRFYIKCTAEGNNYPPQIFWKLDHGPEILAHSQVLQGVDKYVSKAMLCVQSVEKRVTVKCIVHHPAVHSQPLMDFIKIGQNSAKSRCTTSTSSPTVQPQGSTEMQRTTTGWVRHGKTVFLTTRDMAGPSSESSIKLSTFPSNQPFSSSEPKTEPTGFPQNPVTATESHFSTSDNSRTPILSGSTRGRNDSSSNATSTTSWTAASETTSYNHTEGNRTGSFNDPKMQTGNGSSSLLVFLVTCLILGLLVVVIFFAIKLRKAHITWRRENEDSDPSEESSKSKSSQEEKNSQGQRQRGLFNTAFTQYVGEERPVITSVINTAALAATESVNKVQTSQRRTLEQTSAKCDIKETAL